MCRCVPSTAPGGIVTLWKNTTEPPNSRWRIHRISMMLSSGERVGRDVALPDRLPAQVGVSFGRNVLRIAVGSIMPLR